MIDIDVVMNYGIKFITESEEVIQDEMLVSSRDATNDYIDELKYPSSKLKFKANIKGE